MEFVDLISIMGYYMAQYTSDDGVVNIFQEDQYAELPKGI